MSARIQLHRYKREGERPKREGMSGSHLAMLRRCPCVICGKYPSDPHHLLRTAEKGMGRRSSDQWALSMCRTHHDALHAHGDEDAFFAEHGLDGRAIAKSLWSKRGDYDAMVRICENAAWRAR